VALQALEVERPEGAVALEPAVGLGEGGRGELVPAQPPLAALADEARLAEDPEVLGDGGTAGAEVLRQLTDVEPSSAQPIEQRPPGGIGDGSEEVGVRAGPVHR